MIVNQVAIKALNNMHISHRTKTLYKENYNKFFKQTLGDKEINKITVVDIHNVLQPLTTKYSANTIKLICNSFASIFRYAYNNYLLNRLIDFKLIHLENLEFRKKQMIALQTDYNNLLTYIKNSKSKNAKSYYLALQIIRYTGCRNGEVLALTTSDIDLERREIVFNKKVAIRKKGKLSYTIIEKPKTNASNRIVYINDSLKDILEVYLHEISHRVLLPDSDGWYIMPCRLSSFVNYFAKTRGAKITPHMLRHTFATTLLQNRIEADIVKDLLGHSSVQTTLNLYTHRTTSEYLQAVNIIK